MQRTVLIILATAVVAAAIATGATILLTDNNNEIAITSPVPTSTPEATVEVTATPSESPSASPSSSPSPSASASPTAKPTPTPHPIQSAASVDCKKDTKKCSDIDGVDVQDGKYKFVAFTAHRTYPGVPTITMASERRNSAEKKAKDGDTVGSIHVVVTVTNKTSRTFVFPKREIVLDIFRNGKLLDRISTKGAGFEMTPNGKMSGTFDRPLTVDGNYTWQAKTWYYVK